MSRAVASYGYVATLALAMVFLNAFASPADRIHSDSPLLVVFLIFAVVSMELPEVRIDRGRLTLSGVGLGCAAILLNPADATIVGLTLSLALIRRGPWTIVANAVFYATFAGSGAFIASFLRTHGGLGLGERVLVLAFISLENWAVVAVAFRVRTGEAIRSIVRRNFTPSFYAAFAYFGLAGLLLSYVLDGSALGYLLGTIVCVLSLALTDTIAGRRVRTVLESELSDADRHLFHSRAVEGVVHNLRNHMANVVGYLREIDPRRLDPIDRENIATATSAAADAVDVLRTLSQGATPRVSFSPDAVELNELVTRAIGMARPRARAKRIELTVREFPDQLKVHVDPLLMREVLTNLINNAIDAAPEGGRVEAMTGRGSNGSPQFSVRDNGPGVPDENRRRLFEPHFTTKETGTGLGLFMSYGVVREHQGDLVYSGDRRGAVFTVTLPPFAG